MTKDGGQFCMTTTFNPAREEILGNVRMALGRQLDSPSPIVPSSARMGPRFRGDVNVEMEMLLSEIAKLGGFTRQINRQTVRAALAELVRADGVKQATVWDTAELKELGIAAALQELGVELVSPQADKRALAECDLGLTSVDAALPETGTLLLRSAPGRARAVSLLPRIHLALVRPSALRPDLHQAFEEYKHDGCLTAITGPSRTADIELTVTLGVHGPKNLFVWMLEADL
jgi:L-lactate dehydrogenase complex protein LldG